MIPSRQSVAEDIKTTRKQSFWSYAVPPRRCSWYSSCLGWSPARSTEALRGICQDSYPLCQTSQKFKRDYLILKPTFHLIFTRSNTWVLGKISYSATSTFMTCYCTSPVTLPQTADSAASPPWDLGRTEWLQTRLGPTVATSYGQRQKNVLNQLFKNMHWLT